MSVWNVGPGLAQIERVEVVARLLLAHPPRDVVVPVDQAGRVRPAASPGRAAWRSRGSVVIWARGRAVPARVIATAVARRNGGRIASVCTTKVVAGAVSAAPWPVPEARALVTPSGAPATFPAPSPVHGPILGGVGPVVPPRSPASVSGAMDRLEDSDDEDSVGQSHVGVGPRGGSCLRCGRAGSADRRHHRHHHVERRPVHARGDDHRRIAGAPGHAVGGHRRQRHLRRPRAAAGRVRRHHRDGRHGDGQAADARPARADQSKWTSRWRRRRWPSRSPCAPKPRPSSPIRPSAPTSTARLYQPAADRPHAVQHRRARARPDRQRPERRAGDDRRARSPTTTSS